KAVRKKLLTHSILLLIGVLLVFVSLGVSASFLGNCLNSLLIGSSGNLLHKFAGIFIIVMDFFVGGWLNIKALMKEKRVQYKNSRVSYLTTFFVGLCSAAGWTPCIGPIFGSILLLATSNPTQGIIYTVMYVIGFALPFLVLTFFIGSTKWIVQ